MEIEPSVWRISGAPEGLRRLVNFDSCVLEDLVRCDSSILNPDWLLIGHQVQTHDSNYIDLLAIDANGSLIIVEFARDKAFCDVLVQAIDHSSWVTQLSDKDVSDIYFQFAEECQLGHEGLEAALAAKFHLSFSGIRIHDNVQVVIVTSSLEPAGARIINYLNAYGKMAIQVLSLKAFEDDCRQYISRAWLVGPEKDQEKLEGGTNEKLWNGEYYVCFSADRPWNLARELGFISGGESLWHSKTLSRLSKGDRIWVNIPNEGYVGVGIVQGEYVRAERFIFGHIKEQASIDQMSTAARYLYLDSAADEDKAEYIAPVRWIHTVSKSRAFKENGLFQNRNTVCKPTTSKWDHTVARLKQAWGMLLT